jgi:hypothetical protein
MRKDCGMISSNRDEDGLTADNGFSGRGEMEVLLGAIFPGDSEMAHRMRAFDWAASDFGPVEHWPAHLRIAVRLCLTSRFPFLVWWGPRLALLYNDAYLPWLTAAKHPRALGRPGYESRSEVWETIGPMLDGASRPDRRRGRWTRSCSTTGRSARRRSTSRGPSPRSWPRTGGP